MTSTAIRLWPEPLRTLGFAAIGVNYTPIGIPFEHPIRVIHIQNLTNALLKFSWDGSTDHLRLPANGFLLLDVAANRTIVQELYLGMGITISVKQDGIPTSGAVDIAVFYGK